MSGPNNELSAQAGSGRDVTADGERARAGSPRSLAADSVFMLGAKGLVGLINLSSAVIVARTFGPTGQGTVAVALAFALLLTQLGNLGITTANPAYVARGAASMPSIVANSLWLATAVGGLLAALTMAFRAIAPDLMPALGLAELIAVLIALPFALATTYLRSILLGQDRMAAYNGGEVLLSLAAFTALGAGIAVFDVGVWGALALLLSQYPAGLALYLWMAASGRAFSVRPDPRAARAMVAFAARVYVATLVGYLLVRLDLVLVSSVLGARQAGLYSAALVLAQALYLIPMVIGLNLFPRVVKGAGAQQTAAVFRAAVVLFGAACIAAAAVARTALDVFFGPDFDDSLPLLYWLLPATFSLGLLTILTYYFSAIGYPLRATLYWTAGAVLNVLLNLLLLPRYGTVAAPIVSLVCYVLVFALHVRLFARDAGGYKAMVPGRGEAARLIRLVNRESLRGGRRRTNG